MNCKTKNTHKILYWLSVLIEYEKYQKQQKESIQMASRKPVLPDDSSYKHVFIQGSHATDWVWLLWHAIVHGCHSLGKPKECIDTIKALGYVFAYDYTTSKRNSRLPLFIHALQLVYTDIQWHKSLYTMQNETLINRACHNIHLLYIDIHNKKLQNQQQNSQQTQQQQTSTKNNETPLGIKEKTNETKTKQNRSKNNKHKMSMDSYKKMDTFNKIDAIFLGL